MSNFYKIVYTNNSNVLSSLPIVTSKGLGLTYEPGHEYSLLETGPYLCFSCLALAQQYKEQIWSAIRASYQIWEVEAQMGELQPDTVSHGIAPDYLNPENAKAFWSKMKSFDEGQRRAYIVERGGTITYQREDGGFEHLKRPLTGPVGVAPWDYGTVFCDAIKLIKQVK